MPNSILQLLGLARTSGFAAAADYFLSVRTNGERNSTFSHFPHDLVQSICAPHKHKALSLSQHALQLYSNRNLDVARRIYNYRLTQEIRMVACAFGIVCNKWRIFHHAIDICPDFCDVIVKTCCTLYNFVRHRDIFTFRIIYMNVPSRALRLMAITVMLQKRTWGGGLRGLESLSVGAPLGSLAGGVVYWGLMCRKRLWRRAPLSIGTPLGCMGGGVLFTGNSDS